MSDEKLKPCPCGKTPKELHISGQHLAKYAHVSGSCCNEWEIEFRNDYETVGGDKSLKLASEAWNYAPRVNPPL